MELVADKVRKQIIFDVDPDLHAEIKAIAALKKITMNNWIHRAINEQFKKDRRIFVEEK